MKPIGPIFDSSWRKACRIEPCSVKDVDGFIQAHYLAKRPAIVLLALVMLRGETPLGCVIYSAPPREADVRYGGKTWELARLYLLDEVPQNAETWLIAQSVKWIKQNRPEVCNLVSYADPSAGHSGTIYRAANWRDDGRTDDDRKTPRCDYYDARTGKKYGRRGNMPADAVIERRPRVSKYRFALAINRPNERLREELEAWKTTHDATAANAAGTIAALESEIQKLREELDEAKHAVELAESELAGERQENLRLRSIVEFFYDQLQMHSPKMDGKSTWRFRHGWPMTHCIGPTREKAVEAAMLEVERSRNNQKGEEE